MSYQVELKARGINPSPRLTEYIDKKTLKLERYLGEINTAKVEISHNKNSRDVNDRYVAQITISGKGFVLRSEERLDDIYAAFDSALDKIQRRIEKYKGKTYRGRGDGASITNYENEIDMEVSAEDSLYQIARRKKLSLIPMDEEEALLQSELLGHDNFFIYYDINSNSVNVIYKRWDATFGIIETEIA
jgi:putative sigma-54 modulation protein